MKHFKIIGVVICLCLSAQLFAQGIEKKIEKSFNVAAGGSLDLNSDRGSVDISSHSGNRVIIKILLITDTVNEHKAKDIFDDFEIAFKNNGNDVKVEGNTLDHRLLRNKRLKVRFQVTVPEKYNLNIKTGGGNIDVADTKGRVLVKTSGGRIALGKISGKVSARTSGGKITLEGSTGDATLHTSGGDILIGMVDGDIEARTSGGNITVDAVHGNLEASTSGGGLHFRNVNGNLNGRTSGGSIEAELTAQVSEPVELYTTGGNIKLAIPADLKANIAASTFGGRVYTELPVTLRGKIGNAFLNGSLNGGGPEVNLKTMGGNIEIVRNIP